MFARVMVATIATSIIGGIATVTAQDTTTSSSRPPELVKLEAQAATEIPLPPVPPGRAPEVKKVAETSVALRRATWVVEKLLPPPPEGVVPLRLAELKVGARGWIDTTVNVDKIGDGMAIVRPSGVEATNFAVGVGADVADAKVISLRGEYIADRMVTIDGREVIVLKEVAAAKALDPARAKVIDAARERLELAMAAHAQATAVLRSARERATKEVMEEALAKAQEKLPVPKDAPFEEQVKIKAKQQELAAKIAKEKLEEVTKKYAAASPVIDPIDGSGVAAPRPIVPIKK